MDGTTALRNVLKRMWSDRQGGVVGYCGEGEWGFVTTGLPQTTPEELNALFELAGLEPEKIVSKGDCKDCKWSKNGMELGCKPPCVYCLRPRHDLFEKKDTER